MSLATSRPRQALVVGGTSGIGHGIALALAKRQVQVTVAGRSRERGNEIVSQLNDLSDLPHRFVFVDCFDLKSVKELAETVSSSKESSIDYLVMTQGIATLQGYTPTKDHIDQKLQLHVFSRLYLALLLAPKLKQSESRILTVLSAGVHSRYEQFREHFDLKDNYSIKNAADAAGFYNDCLFEELSVKYPELSVVHAAPGFVNTNWGTEMPTPVRWLIRPLQALFGKSLEACGETLTESFLQQPPGFHLMAASGAVNNSKFLRHSASEREFVWEKALEMLPEL